MLRALLIAAAMSSASAEEIRGYVADVHDGDSITIGSARVRIAGIAAPYMDQPWGRASHGSLIMLCYREYARGTIRALHDDGTIVADITCGPYHAAAEQLVRGYAWPTDRQAEIISSPARHAHRGIWSDPSPTPPWLYRRK